VSIETNDKVVTREHKSYAKMSKANFASVKAALNQKGYQVGDKLGSGSFAQVRSIVDKEKNRTLAVKMIDKSSAPKEFVKEFLPKELEVTRKLKHKYIIAAYDIIDIGWYTCIIMEKASIDLLSFITGSKPGSLDEDVARPLFAQMVIGLKFIHEQGVAHRDIKAENILLTGNNDTIKYADFGFARFCHNPKTKMRELSETYCGSAAYAAPEVLLGRPYNPMLSDVWSLGIVLYVMLNGIMPFDDADHSRLLRCQKEKRWGWHPEKKGNLSVQIRRIVKGMLEPDLTLRKTTQRLSVLEWVAEYSTDETPASPMVPPAVPLLNKKKMSIKEIIKDKIQK